jgi:perosamine synthetase
METPAMNILPLPSDQDASGRNLGSEELALLEEVIKSGVLNSTKGTKVAAFEQEFARFYGVSHCTAASSGSSAVHTALAALDPDPGSEVITTAITDMGALAPILYQGCVPVFADVDPSSYNLTAASIEKKLTSKTRAIMVTHLFGNPCDMEPIMKLANARQIPVIEDCAQAYLSEISGRRAGTWGAIGAFSMQQGKHMTTGEGGMCITNDAALARRMKLFVNKAWGYGDPSPDHYFLAPNYRLTELQGAVALAQLKKLPDVVAKRRAAASRLSRKLSGIDGLGLPEALKGGVHVYWKYCLDVDEVKLGIKLNDLAARLKEKGVFAAPRYIQKPAFRCEVFREGRTFGKSHWPLTEETMALYRDEGRCRKEFTGTYQALSRVLVLPWNEFYRDEHVDYIAEQVRGALKP